MQDFDRSCELSRSEGEYVDGGIIGNGLREIDELIPRGMNLSNQVETGIPAVGRELKNSRQMVWRPMTVPVPRNNWVVVRPGAGGGG